MSFRNFDHPLIRRQKSLKERIRNGDQLLGMFLVSGSPTITEVCTTFALDWIVLDAEASSIDKEGTTSLLRSITGSGVPPLVRISWKNQHVIEHALDSGAEGVIIPKVENRVMADEAVRACLYPPQGTRGVNPVRASGYFHDLSEYFRIANDRAVKIVQIESQQAIDQVDQIAETPGLDGIFIGPGDLSSSLGVIGEINHAKMQEAIGLILAACKRAGIMPGIYAYSPELAKHYLALGFQFVAIGNEVKLLGESIARTLRDVTNTHE